MIDGKTASFPSLGTTAQIVVTDARVLEVALNVLEQELQAIDEACSRFRDDSELSQVNAAAGSWITISPLFEEALRVALRAAVLTDGLVDPTLGSTLEALGYDRDFASIVDAGSHAGARPIPAPRPAAWRAIEVEGGRVRIPERIKLDLGATAKALAADRAASGAAARTGAGVLVNLGGDVAIAGPPPADGWYVEISDDHRSATDSSPAIRLAGGGVATSSTTVRRWRRGSEWVHHIVDPATGRAAAVVWRTVSVAARSCVDANIATTASIVMGARAPSWLTGLHLPGRLVRADGGVVKTGGWPAEAA